jgi:hypothetical protein
MMSGSPSKALACTARYRQPADPAAVCSYGMCRLRHAGPEKRLVRQQAFGL